MSGKTQQLKSIGNGHRAVDLFAGAGGLSLGLERAGFAVLLAADNDEAAVRTYRRNLGNHVRPLDLGDGVTLPHADLIVGGPPCQGFSSAGLRRVGDARNSLVGRFAEIIVNSKPAAFVFENVEGFLTYSDGDRVLDLLSPLIDAGYLIHLRKVNAANYGVPQHRKRVLAIGGLGWEPPFPAGTHSAFGAPGAHLMHNGLPPTPTIMDALEGLPSPSLEPPGEPLDQFARALREEELERIQLLKPGQRMRDLPVAMWHQSYRRRAFRRVMDGTPSERRGGAPSGMRRLRSDEPSKAITSGARTEFLHPMEDRYLTLRECARIQTFPDEFVFEGTLSQRALLIGNAVPPHLGFHIGKALADSLPSQQPRAKGKGRLITFVPTASEGMSPALARVVERVDEAFAGRTREPQPALWA